MGGERASTTRQREAGKICCNCHSLLDATPWHRGGERYCVRCGPTRRVYLSFFVRGNGTPGGTWLVQFLEPDLRTPVGRIRSFGSAEKIRTLVARTPTRLALDDRQAFDYGIQTGRGGMYLELTPEQYAKLCS